MPKTRIVFIKKKKEVKKNLFRIYNFDFQVYCSPIKYHINKLRKDECSEMLMNNFCIDHLIKSRNSPGKLIHLYKETVEE